MSDQLQLLPEKAPSIDASEIARMCLVLEGAGWLTAEDVAQVLFLHAEEGVTEAHKRRIRAIANASDGRILSYPGSKGYKLTRQATVEEINTATAKLRHQAGEMHQRALEIDRVYHGKKR
jgi:hypothetical protein